MRVFPPNSSAESLMPQGRLLGGGASGRGLGRGGGALVNGRSALKKRDPRELPVASITSWEVCNLEEALLVLAP